MRNRGSNCAPLPTTSSPLLVDASPIVNSITSILNATSGSELNIEGRHRALQEAEDLSMERRLNIRQYANKGEDINATLNRLATLAKKEVGDCYTGICDNNKYRTKIEAHYIPLIERLAKDNWYRINNETHFIEDCFRKIRYAIRSFDIDRGDFDNRVRWLVYQSVRHYCGSRGKEREALTLIGDINVLETLENCTDTTEEKAIYNISTYEETYARLYKNICKRK